MSLPNCLQCQSEYVYEDGLLLICPMCAFEWTPGEEATEEEGLVVLDSNGVRLSDGDTITVVKDLKVKGAQRPETKGLELKYSPGGR